MASHPRDGSADPDLLIRAIGEVPLAFVDVETTGFSPNRGDRVCEIAIVRRVGVRVEARFTSLINPERPLDPRAAGVNGITPEMVRIAPCFREVVADVARLLDGAAFVAHNAGFDRGFVRAELDRAGHGLTTITTVDTLALARVHLAGLDHRLGSLARSLQLTAGQHRARGDVDAMCGLFDHLVARLVGWSTPLHVFVGGQRSSSRTDGRTPYGSRSRWSRRR